MRVRFRFLCVDLPNYSGNEEIDIADGATVEQALREHARLNGMGASLAKLSETMFLIGKKPAKADTVLQDKDEVTVMRILHGG